MVEASMPCRKPFSGSKSPRSLTPETEDEKGRGLGGSFRSFRFLGQRVCPRPPHAQVEEEEEEELPQWRFVGHVWR